MVGTSMYTEIQKRRALGYSKRRCARELEIDKKTVGKYWEMSEEEYAQCVVEAKRRTRTLDPYREFIVSRLEEYPESTSAIIEDNLREEFKKGFNASYRSVRLYVAMLREELGIPKPVSIRQYCEVEEQPLGFQTQVDMGQKMMTDMYGKRVKVYIFAMVMSASRMKFVCFQDRPFNAQAFIEAHDLAFRYFGGRPVEIVYDQDRVMAVSENAGDILYTEAFEAYRQYAGFSIRLCRGNDPQSKGKIERVIGYIKNGFLSCRKYQGISQLNSDGLSWLDRTANTKIHETTKMVPKHVFIQEQKHLRPAPALSAPTPPRTAIVRPDNVVHYRQNRYAVPRGTYAPGRKARIETDEEKGTVTFYDAETDELIAVHTIRYGKGNHVPLPSNADRFRGNQYELLRSKVLERFNGLHGAG
ncbi:MAG: IS21 family transposase [Oscillospiraceae bacterium]|nr:IS21 family transposase [Oscillospiraceae bacterium]